MAPLTAAEETCWAADLPRPHPKDVCGPDDDRIPPRGRPATSVGVTLLGDWLWSAVLAPSFRAGSSLISRGPSRARIPVSAEPERVVIAATIPAAAPSSFAACGISLPRRYAAPLRASCAVVAVRGGAKGVETSCPRPPRSPPRLPRPPPRPQQSSPRLPRVAVRGGTKGVETSCPRPPRSPPKPPRPPPLFSFMATSEGRLPVGFPPADARPRCIWLGNRLETLTERQPYRRVPRLRFQPSPCEGSWVKGGCFAGGRSRSARPEVRSEGLGCPSPALHGTS